MASTLKHPGPHLPRPWVSPAHGRSEYLRLRSVVDALVSIAEHAGDTASFLDEATETIMQLTRATGAVVLMAAPDSPLAVASARGQFARVDPTAFGAGHTLAQECLRSHQALHSQDTRSDSRILGPTRKAGSLDSLIATPLRYGNAVLGVLEVCSSVPHAFDDIDTQAVALFGNALGGALGRQVALDDNARLLAQLETALEATQAKARKYQDAALYDALTRLPNRAHFVARLKEACVQHRGAPGGFAVLFLDLDEFKQINDTHGHAMGDAVLRQAAQVVGAPVRRSRVVARLGGDEFVVLLTRLRHGERDVETVAAHLVDALARPQHLGEMQLPITASVGWVLHDGSADAATVLAAADRAMYRHKKARRKQRPTRQ